MKKLNASHGAVNPFIPDTLKESTQRKALRVRNRACFGEQFFCVFTSEPKIGFIYVKAKFPCFCCLRCKKLTLQFLGATILLPFRIIVLILMTIFWLILLGVRNSSDTCNNSDNNNDTTTVTTRRTTTHKLGLVYWFKI